MTQPVRYVLLFVVTAAVWGQQVRTASPEQLLEWERAADEAKLAMREGHLLKASRLLDQASRGMLTHLAAAAPSAKERLAEIQQGSVGVPRFPLGAAMTAMTAFEADELDIAEQYAHEALERNTDPKQRWYAQTNYLANTVVGRVALKRDKDIARANSSLLASARLADYPGLPGFGPDLRLARELLAAGERAAVLQFLRQCGSFWKAGESALIDWIVLLEAGRTPDLKFTPQPR